MLNVDDRGAEDASPSASNAIILQEAVGVSPGPETPGWNDYEGYAQEYRLARQRFVLEVPEGDPLPLDPPPEPEPGALYQYGTGDVTLLLAWLRKVQTAAVELNRIGDSAGAQHWVEVAAQFVETDTFAKYNDPNVPISWFDDVILRARAGDFTTMANNVGLREVG